MLLMMMGVDGEHNSVFIPPSSFPPSLPAHNYRSVGDWVPLDTERGHHVKFQPDSEGLLTRAVCDPSQGFLMAPMAGGIRSAGTVELGGTASGITKARCRQLEGATSALFGPAARAQLGERIPGLDWVGFRPSMPDALPVLGRSSRNPKVTCHDYAP